jgi:hypothetical protein
MIRFAAFSIFLLQGCAVAGITNQWADLEGCRPLSFVEANGKTQRTAELSLINKAEDVGGNTVFINPAMPELFRTHDPSVLLEGRAYACEN